MDTKDKSFLLFGAIISLFGFMGTMVFLNYNEKNTPNNSIVCECDSLKNVIDSLQSDIRILEDGFDEKEKRYSDVINEYEIGVSYLKDYHPNAYQDFHRIIGMKEHYSRDLDRENKKRLQSYK